MNKININTAKESELKKLPGVGTVAAKKIIAFRETGGTFNNFEEVKNVAKIRTSYVDSLKNNLGFKEILLVNPNRSFDTAIAVDPREPLVQFPLPVFNSYSFTVELKGSGNSNLPDLKGYKLIVGYRLGAFKGFGKTKYNSKTVTYNLGSQSSQRVSIVKPLVRSSFIEDTFNLLIVSPTGKNIFDSSFEIDENATVDIGLPVFAERELDIKLNKQPQINYAGYQLVVNSKINRSTSGIERQTDKFEIASANSFLLKFDSFGDVIDIKFEVLSPDSAVIFSETKAWEILTGTANKKKNDIALPSPNNVGYTIKLVIDPDQLNNPYLDHKVSVTYELIDPETLNHINQIEKTFSIAANGKATISINYYGLIERMDIDVKAPSGEIIGTQEVQLPLDNNTIEIKVPPKALAGIEGFESLPARPKKTTGRVIDLKGDRTFEKVQVIIHVATVEDPTDDDFNPLLITDTVKDGYLVFDTPNSYFTEAYASIGIPKKGNVEGLVFKVPIRLETDIVTNITPNGTVLIDKLFFPPHVILVVDVESQIDEEKDCNCNDCGDLDFHRPKKVVDEFSFYTVVRTTEPNIQGYVLDDDGEMSIQEILTVVQLADEPGSSAKNLPIAIQNQAIRKNILMKHINDKRGLTITTLTKALNESNALKLRESIRPKQEIKAYGRHKLDLDHAINWDENPKIYQATTLSHGHLLHFKQEWVNDGYGMGDLLYSLPLAPGQKKQIVVYDWERRESAAQVQSLDYQDSLNNSLSRDRDVNEIVTGSLSESSRGGSSASTSSFGGGFGIGAIIGPVGALLGVAGGSSKASSSAWQNSSRNTSLNDLQQLRDRTVQSANSVRSQRSTVIATASQGERFSVETEVVANYNHCHSLTIQYFEVLRHMLIQQRLSNVQECLFIPLILDTFDHQKTLRWRENIQRYIRSAKLRKGFDAIERIENDYEGSDLPEGTYAQQNIEYLEGGIYIKFDISSPIDLEFVENKAAITSAFTSIFAIIPSLANHIDRIFDAELKKRNEVFNQYVAPEIAAAFVENLNFEAVVESSQDGTETTVSLPVDTTLTTRFNNGQSHYVTLRQHSDFDGVSRESVKAINIRKAQDVIVTGGISLAEAIPVNSKIIITSGNLNYRTAYSSGHLFSKSRILDDLLGYGGVADENERVRIATPLSREELRNPRSEDLEFANKLQDHLNDNLEAYHKVIWMSMSSERRFMFLDGIQVTDYSNIEQYPGGIIRSVASVVENRIIGVVGNSLVMPVAPGFRLDPNTRGKDVDLLALYQPITPIEPINISIPTKGVFAEAVMGKCNSCEVKEEDRFWRWEESPIPDSPTAIGQVSTDSRRSEPLDTTAKDFPAPIINIQNAPAAPDPTGLAAAQALLGTSSFKDITGLEQNQKNAIDGLKASLSAAQAFGTKAGDMAALGAQLEAIKKAKENKLLDEDKAKELTEKSLEKFMSGSIGNGNVISDGISQIKQVKDMVSKGELPSSIGDNLTKHVLDTISKANTNELENPAVQERIKGGDSFDYVSKEGSSMSMDNEKNSKESNENTIFEPIFYNVPLIPQPNKTSCWAASMAMIESYRLSEEQQATIIYSANQLADDFGYSLEQSYGWDRLNDVKEGLGLETIKISGKHHPSAKQWRDMLIKYGPLYVTIEGVPSHAIVVNGISGDSTSSGTKIDFLNPTNTTVTFDNNATDFNPPNDGLKSTLSVEDLNKAFNVGELSELAYYENWRILYHPDLGLEAKSLPSSTGQTVACANLPSLIDLRTEALKVARAEALHWTDNNLKEDSPAALSRLQEYYLASIDRTLKHEKRSIQVAISTANDYAKEASRGKSAWSAVYISWCYVKAYSNLNPGVVGWTIRDYAKCLKDNQLFDADLGHFGYVTSALNFPGNVYINKNSATTNVEVGDWIFANREPSGTHVDIVLELFDTLDRTNNPIKWALTTGGNITHQTAGYRIYSIDTNGLLTTNHNALDHPNDADLQSKIGLNLTQINSWRGTPDSMRGLVRLS